MAKRAKTTHMNKYASVNTKTDKRSLVKYANYNSGDSEIYDKLAEVCNSVDGEFQHFAKMASVGANVSRVNSSGVRMVKTAYDAWMSMIEKALSEKGVEMGSVDKNKVKEVLDKYKDELIAKKNDDYTIQLSTAEKIANELKADKEMASDKPVETEEGGVEQDVAKAANVTYRRVKQAQPNVTYRRVKQAQVAEEDFMDVESNLPDGMVVDYDVYNVKKKMIDQGIDAEHVDPEWFEYEVFLMKNGEIVDAWDSLSETYDGQRKLTQEDAQKAAQDVQSDPRDYFDYFRG